MNLPNQAPPRKRLVRSAPMLLLTGALAVAGCGSSSKTPSTPSTSSVPASSAPSVGATLSVSANPEGLLKFDTSSLTAKAGSVSIAFTNMSSLSHNLTVESSAHKIVGATATFAGGAHVLPLNLKPGTYKFFCSVPGHRAAGMEGTLTVQ
ncbi:MAG TPA: plastocyanin/azurin family copper-binding protein [Solirubrobacteraceae bacterium]|nr:plastocyanin/azurin family copper-binding protein [Solirubrobacteraceae bacterium]